MQPGIVYQNKDFMVLDKPTGWVVNNANTTKGQLVVQDWLRGLGYPIADNEELRSGIVHRLDKETSGLLVVAKNENTQKYIQKQFKDRLVKKKYLALLHGVPVEKTGEILTTVGRLPWNRKRFGVLPGGRESHTVYKVVSEFERDGKPYSLVEFLPKTGRTHQLRIHAKSMGHPIVSDSFYAGRKIARGDRKWCPRLFLHAGELTFKNPAGKFVTYKSDLPDELQKVLSSFS